MQQANVYSTKGGSVKVNYTREIIHAYSVAFNTTSIFQLLSFLSKSLLLCREINTRLLKPYLQSYIHMHIHTHTQTQKEVL